MKRISFGSRAVSLLLFATLVSAHTMAWAQTLPAAQAPKPLHRDDVPAALVKKAGAMVDADAKRLVDIYKDLHQNPELGFMEIRTAAIAAKELAALGYDVKTGIGTTGVVGILRNGPGPTLMFRAGQCGGRNQRPAVRQQSSGQAGLWRRSAGRPYVRPRCPRHLAARAGQDDGTAEVGWVWHAGAGRPTR